MIDNIISIFITPAMFSIILALVYLFLYKEEKQKYLKLWSVAWFINALGFIASLLNQLDKSFLWQGLMNAGLILGTIFLVLGSLNFCGKRSHFVILFISALGMIWYIVGLYYKFPFLLLNVPIFFLVGTTTIMTGQIYLTLTSTHRTGKIITAGSFIAVGVINLMYPFLILIKSPKSLIHLVSLFGKIGIIIGTLILYFERNKSELDNTKKSLKALAENTPDIIFRYKFEPIQELQYINPAFTHSTGFSCEDLLSNPSLFINILHPQYHDLITQLLKGRLNFEETLEFMVYHKNGQRVFFEGNIIPQYRSDGNLLALEGIVRDVTHRKLMEEEIRGLEDQQRKQTEMALFMAEDRFSKAFYKSPYPMAISSKDFCIREANDNFVDSISFDVNYGSANLEVKNLFVEIKEYQNLIKLVEENQLIRNFQLRFLSKTGGIRTGLLSMEDIVLDGKESILLVINDISDLIKLEAEITRLDRLNLIGQMAAGIGHEVRNPMTTVRGFLQLLGSKKQYSELKEHFDLMISELDRANSIISEFLSLARKTPAELKPDNLNEIINILLPLLLADALNQDKNIQVVQEEIPYVYVNRKEIKQLILNLVRNGLDAMSQGGSVTIKTFLTNNQIVLSVCDEGCGIDPNVYDKLGTPFITTKPEGTGLGLATCYSIAERNNARITVETSPQGAIFNIWFQPYSHC